MIIGSVDKTAETQAEKGIDNPFAKWYVLSAYMTDGSGNDHREYKPRKPTVWAYMLGQWAFLCIRKSYSGLPSISFIEKKEKNSWKCYH